MAPVTGRPRSSRAQRREEIRGRLLEVVEELLAEGESFTELSVERLVSRAELSRSTFYVYFEGKGDLLTAWFEGITDALEGSAAGWWALGADARREDLRAALDAIVVTYRPHATLMAAIYDAAAYDLAVRELVEGMMSTNAAALRKHIRAGQAAGFVDPALAAPQVAGWLTWMAERSLHQLIRTATDGELRGLVDAYTGIVWNTLYAPTRR
ncbi:MAG: ethR 1 [Solirubrobacterales bacterium]|nr:ethR 1 [Solirubrobacterales bacterium]